MHCWGNSHYCKMLLGEVALHLSPSFECHVPGVPEFCWLKGNLAASSKEGGEEGETWDLPWYSLLLEMMVGGDSWAGLFLHQTRERQGISCNVCCQNRLNPVIVSILPPHQAHTTSNSSSNTGSAPGCDKLDNCQLSYQHFKIIYQLLIFTASKRATCTELGLFDSWQIDSLKFR